MQIKRGKLRRNVKWRVKFLRVSQEILRLGLEVIKVTTGITKY